MVVCLFVLTFFILSHIMKMDTNRQLSKTETLTWYFIDYTRQMEKKKNKR